MKRILLMSLLTLAPLAQGETPTAPEVMNLTCRCESPYCASTKPVNVTYNRKTLFLELDSPTWSYSGYVTRQVSKVTNTTHLILPAGYVIGPIKLRIDSDGQTHSIRIGSDSVTCK